MPISEPAPAPWSVVIVPFPYSDRLREKRRPALVISSEHLEPPGLLWIAMITSANNPPWDSDIALDDEALAGLSAPSVIRPAKIACIEQSRIVRRAGKITAEVKRAVIHKLRRFLAD